MTVDAQQLQLPPTPLSRSRDAAGRGRGGGAHAPPRSSHQPENGLALGVGSSVVGTTTTGVHEGSLGPSATNSEARKVHSGKSEGSLAWAPTFSGSGLRRRPGTSSGSGRRQPLQFEEGIEIYTDSKSREYHEETSLDSIHYVPNPDSPSSLPDFMREHVEEETGPPIRITDGKWPAVPPPHNGAKDCSHFFL